MADAVNFGNLRMFRYMVSTSVVVSIVLSNKKTPVTVGGFELPFAPFTKAQNPPVTGVLINSSEQCYAGFSVQRPAVRQCKDRGFLEHGQL